MTPATDLLTKALSREQTERDRLIKELQQTELKISSYEAALKMIEKNGSKNKIIAPECESAEIR
jgi:predicted DNA-binding protein YlxM (UPF0122 family)